MFQLLMRPQSNRLPLRRLVGRLIGAAREFTHTPAPIATPVAPADLPPVGLYEADEVPPVEDIEAAAAAFDVAAQQSRAGDRGKRAARKILDRLPAGQYGRWLVSRKASSRQTADLDAIRETYKRLGLGPVPMKTSAPSLKVERVAVLAEVSA